MAAYLTPEFPDGQFNLEALDGGWQIGPFTRHGWEVGPDGTLECWPSDGSRPVRLRVRAQEGEFLEANDGDMGPMTFRIVRLGPGG